MLKECKQIALIIGGLFLASHNCNILELINSSFSRAYLSKSSHSYISRRLRLVQRGDFEYQFSPWIQKIKEAIYPWPTIQELEARGENDTILVKEGRRVYEQYFSSLTPSLTKVREELVPVLGELDGDIEKVQEDIEKIDSQINAYSPGLRHPKLMELIRQRDDLNKQLGTLNENRKIVIGIINESRNPLTIRSSDEYVYPLVANNGKGRIKPGDLVIDTNWRADRRVEMHYAVLEQFLGHSYTKLANAPFKQEIFDIVGKHLFSRALIPEGVTWVPLALYDDNFLRDKVLFPPVTVKNPIGRVLSALGIASANIAESEKYNHVSRFFNGDTDEKLPGQDTVLINSPTDVDTYDKKPEMSAPQVADEAIKRIESGQYRFVFINFANPDMVGHTGNFPAVVKAVEAVDRELGRVTEVAKKTGYAVIIFSDHGNAEEMFDRSGGPHTAHTTNKVPFIIVTPEGERFALKTNLPFAGVLGNFAPTALELMGIKEIPPEMLESLIKGPVSRKYKGVVGILLDGWGVRKEREGNAVLAANTPNFNRYKTEGSYTELEASGEAVGLTEGDMGNSEVGHMNIGAGYIVEQQFTKVLRAIDEGFDKVEGLVKEVEAARSRGGDIHIMGLLSDGNIHSSMEVWYALLKLVKQKGLKVYLHPFLDGRDSPPQSAARSETGNPGYLLQLENKISELKVDAELATIMGRFYAMDRDMRWVRIFIAFNALFNGIGVPIQIPD